MQVLGKTIQYIIISVGGIYGMIAFTMWQADLFTYMHTWSPLLRAIVGILVIASCFLSYKTASDVVVSNKKKSKSS